MAKEIEVKEDVKSKSLAEALAKIEKTYGKGTIMKLGEKPDTKIDAISSGSLGLDIALGIGGYPKGRIVEIYGPESSGKTTLAIHAMAEAQKLGGKVAIIDAEQAFDPFYAKSLGVDVDSLYISQPDNGEQGFGIAETLIASGSFAMVVIDSVAALVPEKELAGEYGDSQMGLHARLMSQACRKLVGLINKTGTIVIFINQLRSKIGVVYGSPDVTTGGNALKYYASIRLDVRRAGQVKDGDEITANKTKVKVVKCKVAPPFKETEFDIEFGIGISKIGEIIDYGIEIGRIIKSGSWYSLQDGTKLGQGTDALKILLNDNLELCNDIENEIRIKYGL